MTTRGNHIVFYGASDDLAEVEEVGVTGGFSEEACNDGSGRPLVWLVKDPATGYRLCVVCVYGATTGCTWSIGVAQYDEGEVPPPWSVWMEPSCSQGGYSVRLHVQSEEGHVFTVEEVKP